MKTVRWEELWPRELAAALAACPVCREPSLVMALYPDLGDLSRCPDPETGPFLWAGPAALEASAALGEELVACLADRLGQGAARLRAEVAAKTA